MTWTSKPIRDDVLHAASSLGFAVNFLNQGVADIPEVRDESEGTSIGNNEGWGLRLRATSAGHIVKLGGVEHNGNALDLRGDEQNLRLIFDYVFSAHPGGPHTNDAWIGWGDDSDTATGHCIGLDLTNEQTVIMGSSKSVSIPNSVASHLQISVKMLPDPSVDNEVTVRFSSDGVQHSHTENRPFVGGMDYHCRIEHDGADGEEIRLPHMRYAIYPGPME